jgi:Iap family predicted aminopeptidase
MKLALGLLAALVALQADEISRSEMEQTIDRFSVLDRISGGPGEREAVAYLKDKLVEYGVPFEGYPVDLYLSHPMSASVEVLEPEPLTFASINHAFSASTPAEGVEGELIYIGRNMTADPFDAPLIDYEKIDVRGKIVLDDGYPAPYRAWATEEHGARAQIFINPDDRLHNMTVTTIWGSPTPESAHRLPENPIVAVIRRDGQRLQDLLADGHTVRVRVKGEVSTKWRPSELVVAEIEAEGDEAGEFVLVGGHLDSWHEGVTDNATGNALMLELARLLHQRERARLRRSVRIAWWPGHSPGRYAGSAWYADHFYESLRRNAVAYVNIDSPGSRSGTILRARNMAELEEFNFRNIEEVLGTRPTSSSRPGKVGDESFVGIGVPSVNASNRIPADSPDRGVADGSGGSWWWHSTEDSRDKADLDLLVRDAGYFRATVLGLATPRILPYDFQETAAEMKERLDAIDGYDTSSLGNLVDRFGSLAARLAVVKPEEVSDPAAFNRGLIRITRAINTVFYSRSGPYDQDSNELIPLFPGISVAEQLRSLEERSDAACFLRVRLLREENRIAEGLRTAIGIAEGLLVPFQLFPAKARVLPVSAQSPRSKQVGTALDEPRQS